LEGKGEIKMKIRKYIIYVSILCVFIGFLFIATKVFATNESYVFNYDDEISEKDFKVYFDSGSDYQNLYVAFDTGETNPCLVKGVKYLYKSVGSGPYNVEIALQVDGGQVTRFDTGIPQVGVETWRTFY